MNKYTVEVMFRYFNRQYPTAVIIDRHQNLVQYQIASDACKLNLAKLFNFLEVCVADSKVEEYSISQTTLERVSHFIFIIQF